MKPGGTPPDASSGELVTAPYLGARSLHVDPDTLPDGWEAAQQLHRLKRQGGPHIEEITERAVEAVVQRARSLLRHARRPSATVKDVWPTEGELDLDASLQNPRPWGPGDLVVERRELRDADVVAILDMSLSMTGEKVALVAVAAAILRLKLGAVGLVAFDTNAHTLVGLGQVLPVREVVRRVLMVPAQGYTHIHAGLECGLEQLRRSRRRERVGLLLSDGIYNMGHDPVRMASRYPSLHVVQLGRDLPQGRRSCVGMAQAGRGKRFHAPTYAALPRVVKRVVRELF